MQVNRRRPGELYSDNINAIMDTIQVEEPRAAAPAAEAAPAAGSDGNADVHVAVFVRFYEARESGLGKLEIER